jgi:hypothetical protein
MGIGLPRPLRHLRSSLRSFLCRPMEDSMNIAGPSGTTGTRNTHIIMRSSIIARSTIITNEVWPRSATIASWELIRPRMFWTGSVSISCLATMPWKPAWSWANAGPEWGSRTCYIRSRRIAKAKAKPRPLKRETRVPEKGDCPSLLKGTVPFFGSLPCVSWLFLLTEICCSPPSPPSPP